ncbi:hypothetical protein R3P38DRAFT_3182616 [Favolaschia claudopus]|uniref:Uncharacterized protein n=1 Tax=Favolaschia claudopus TaxID=2862362 RepID=A0AAW0CFH3_9AGAR
MLNVFMMFAAEQLSVPNPHLDLLSFSRSSTPPPFHAGTLSPILTTRISPAPPYRESRSPRAYLSTLSIPYIYVLDLALLEPIFVDTALSFFHEGTNRVYDPHTSWIVNTRWSLLINRFSAAEIREAAASTPGMVSIAIAIVCVIGMVLLIVAGYRKYKHNQKADETKAKDLVGNHADSPSNPEPSPQPAVIYAELATG